MIVTEGEAACAIAAKIVSRGGVIGYRTDTFYGLGADPANAAAVRQVADLKDREGKPILILISDPDLSSKYVQQTSELFDRLANRCWPGPLTLIGKATKEMPHELTAGTGTVGIRVPADDAVRALVRSCGGALTATSANPTGKPPARTAAEVARYFPGGIDLVVDGGNVNAKEPSTVVDLSGPNLVMVREGAISREDLDRFMEGES